jgi:hypothetical protein
MADGTTVELTTAPEGSLGGPPADPKSGLSGPPADTPPADKPSGDTPPAAPADKAPIAPADKAPPATAKTPTIADSKDAKDQKAPVTPADWPEDWRAKLAGDDKKLLERLGRFTKPQDIVNSWRALEQKVSGGEFKKALPSHYTAEELAEYNKANGIPEKWEDYKVEVPGLVLGEHDKPAVDSWKQYAHANHLPPEIVNMGFEWWSREQEKLVDRMAERDQQHVAQGSDQLRATWGKEYQPNLNALGNLYAGAPQVDIDGVKVGMWDAVMSARTPDGRMLGNLPGFMDWQVSLSKTINPFATHVPDSSSDPAKSIESRYDELTNMSRDKQGAYWRGAQADSLQQEMRGAIEALQRSGRMDENGRIKKAA